MVQYPVQQKNDKSEMQTYFRCSQFFGDLLKSRGSTIVVRNFLLLDDFNPNKTISGLYCAQP